MHRSSWLFRAAVLLFCAGCAEPPVEHTARKVTAEDVRRDTEKAVETAEPAAVRAREELEIRLISRLADMEAEITKLHEKGLVLKDEAKARWNDKMAHLKAKHEAARKKLDELGRSTGEAWERLEKGAQSAWDDLQKAFKEASDEF